MAIERFEDLDLTKRYTYADYVSWQFRERVELFKGWVMRMAGPNTYHQRVSARLAKWLLNELNPLGCEVLTAPTDVLIAQSVEGDSVVQPDILVVCDHAKIEQQYVRGAPDFIIEIVSPGNGKKELKRKYGQYQEAGVREYWVVHPSDRTVLRYVLNEAGTFEGLPPETEDTTSISCTIFPGVSIDGADIFP